MTLFLLSACSAAGAGSGGEVDLGEAATIPSANGKVTADLTIESITPVSSCSLFPGSPVTPQNGYLVHLEIHATTTTADSPQENAGVPFDDTMMHFIAEDGSVHEDVGTATSQACLAHEERFPVLAMGPGGEYSGGLVLDVPASTGSIAFTDAAGEVWLWEF